MLNKNINILMDLNLTQENISVNEIIESVTNSLKAATTDIIGNIINSIQQNILDNYLGTRGNEFANKMVPWECSHCAEN